MIGSHTPHVTIRSVRGPTGPTGLRYLVDVVARSTRTDDRSQEPESSGSSDGWVEYQRELLISPSAGPFGDDALRPGAGRIVVSQTADLLADLVAEPTSGFRQLLLTVEPSELWGAPWEQLEDRLARRVLRWSDDIDEIALEPVDMPVSVLFVDIDEPQQRTGADDPTDQFPQPRLHPADRYFRTMRLRRTDADAVVESVGSGSFDIVHIGCRTNVDAAGNPIDDVVLLDGSIVDLDELCTALDQSRTRLVVLEMYADTADDVIDPATTLRIAHEVFHGFGGAVLVSERTEFDRFYYDITHDRSLTDLIDRLPQLGIDPVLLLRSGSDDTLRLYAAGLEITAGAEAEHTRLVAAREAFIRATASDSGSGADEYVVGIDPQGPGTGGGGASGFDPRVGRVRLDLDRSIDLAADLANRTYSYRYESDGLEPMTVTTRQLRELRRQRRSIPETGRVVNSWFRFEGDDVDSSSSLVADREHQLVVNIGTPDIRSAVRQPVPVDEGYLQSVTRGGAVPLTVVVSSTDFEIADSIATLRLPMPIGDSEPATFDVRTPPVSGTYRLRVGIYHDNNLLQSVIHRVAVTRRAHADDQIGNRGEVEWVMSSTFNELDEMTTPAIQILTNDDGAGNHTFVFTAVSDGPNQIHQQLDIDANLVDAAAGDARDKLQSVCSTFKDGELHEYRYRDRRRNPEQQFLEDLRQLARVGGALFAELKYRGGPAFATALDEQLSGSQLIQVAAVKSADYAFPWSLVHDHDFYDTDAARLCPVVDEAIRQGATGANLATLTCFTGDCAHRHDVDVVCPSGFWGFRHIVEQPLLDPNSAARQQHATDDPARLDELDETNAAAASGVPRYDVPLRIARNGSLQLSVGVSERLSDWEGHTDAVAATLGALLSRSSRLHDVVTDLRRPGIHLAYFYCHGGKDGNTAFLGLGRKGDKQWLFAHYLSKANWSNHHPFVFINGCRTVGVTPRDLQNFNRALASSQAAGVLGTEISIPEELAQPVGLDFARAFAVGVPVGTIVRDIRLDLLARRNPLGLAYTPYCMADLRLAAA